MKKIAQYLLPPIFNPWLKNWSIEARLLQWLTCLLLCVGLITLLSASYAQSFSQHGDGFLVIKKQLRLVVLGIIGFNVIVNQRIEFTLKYSPLLFFSCLLLIIGTLVPGLGTNVNGASRWIFGLQPSELIKPFLILQAACVFGRWSRLPLKTRLFWLGIFTFMLGCILKQPNLSTTGLCGMTLWLIAVVAEIPWIYLIATSLGGLIVAGLSLLINPYQLNRVISFLDPFADPLGQGYQLIQSLLAIASGGIWGSGFGLSQQKLAYLPFADTDFIFAVFAEEFGLIGCVILIGFLLFYATLGLDVARKCQNRVKRLIASGVTIILIGQSFLHIGVASGVLPTTGLPFPLFSYGGSSMFASLLLAGLLVRVARESSQASLLHLHKNNKLKQKVV